MPSSTEVPGLNEVLSSSNLFKGNLELVHGHSEVVVPTCSKLKTGKTCGNLQMEASALSGFSLFP